MKLENFVRIFRVLFAENEINLVSITNCYKGFLLEDDKFYFSEFLILLILYGKMTIDEKLNLFYDFLIMFQEKSGFFFFFFLK